MRTVLLSDWHIGLTKEKAIRRQLELMVAYSPELIVNLGDNCGGIDGAKSTRTITKFIREYFPVTPIVACLGNHDYWCSSGRRGSPSPERFAENLMAIKATFAEFNVHFLDTDGPFRSSVGATFVGHTLWYGSNPNTNDLSWMPIALDGDTHRYMRTRAYSELFANLDKLTEADSLRVFCSHFPVVEFKSYLDIQYSGSKQLGDTLMADYNISKFMNGHAHQRHEGPLRYEPGSDYGNPRFLTIEI